MNDQQSARLILVAIDDNNGIWYEQVIPFLLSLQKAEFDGDVGFISYGLSEYKTQLLTEKGYKVFDASRKYSELLLDRQISAADIAEKHHYEQVALYDADIWFPVKLTIFDEITDNQKMYAAPDIWRCTFLTSCLGSDYSQDEANHKLNVIQQKFGYVLQAGLLLAHREGWIKYRDYVDAELATPNRFKMEYGVDATLFNFYAYDTEQVCLIDKKYNCSPPWGARIDYPNGRLTYTVDGQEIQGFHITRATRKSGMYSYHNIFGDEYYQKGKEFRPTLANYYNITRSSIIDPYKEAYSPSTTLLRLELAHTYEYLSFGLTRDSLSYPDNSFALLVSGDATIELSNPHEQAISFEVSYTGLLNREMCDEVYVETKHGKAKLTPSQAHRVHLQPNETVKLLTQEVNFNKRISWILHNVGLI